VRARTSRSFLVTGIIFSKRKKAAGLTVAKRKNTRFFIRN
jgi:hypothetical protein